mgnify:CR=1 FL=1
MSLWAMITIVSVSGMLFIVLLTHTKAKAKQLENSSNAELESRLADLEARMANIESVMVHREKEAKWDALK